jgi:hypothetical protein
MGYDEDLIEGFIYSRSGKNKEQGVPRSKYSPN